MICRVSASMLLALTLGACGLGPRIADDPTINYTAYKAGEKSTDQLIREAHERGENAKRKVAADAAKAACAKKGGVGIGMTKAQVYASCWGKPEKINVTTTSGGDHEQLVYPGYQYVYLRSGIVTSIQTSRRD